MVHLNLKLMKRGPSLLLIINMSKESEREEIKEETHKLQDTEQEEHIKLVDVNVFNHISSSPSTNV